MEKEILISDDEYETRCAVLEEGVVTEIYIERKAATQTLGNLYKGRVENVLPGMQVAFVDIGLDRHAFLHISDLKYESANEDDLENANGKSAKNAVIVDLKAKQPNQSPRWARVPIFDKRPHLEEAGASCPGWQGTYRYKRGARHKQYHAPWTLCRLYAQLFKYWGVASHRIAC